MQVIIFVAGDGTRMRTLTETEPKPLLTIGGVSILTWILCVLPDAITEVILVIGYKGEMIQAKYGSEYAGRKIRYVWQEPRGTGTFGALLAVLRELGNELDPRFLVLNGDDLFGSVDLAALIQHRFGMLVANSDAPQNFGVVSEDPEHNLLGIIEKPRDPQGTLVNTGAFVLGKGIFDYPPPFTGKEQYLTHAVTEFAKVNPVRVVRAGFWFPVGTPEALMLAEDVLRSRGELV